MPTRANEIYWKAGTQYSTEEIRNYVNEKPLP